MLIYRVFWMHSFLPAVSFLLHLHQKETTQTKIYRVCTFQEHKHTRFLKEGVCVCVCVHIYIMDWIMYFNIDDVKNDDKR
jgi:hypothetical protein